MVNYSKIADKLYGMIKGQGFDVKSFTEDGKETVDTAEAVYFFVSDPNIMVALDQDNATIRFHKSKDLPLAVIDKLRKQIRKLSQNNVLNFEFKVVGKEITPKEYSYETKRKERTMESIDKFANTLKGLSGWDVYIRNNYSFTGGYPKDTVHPYTVAATTGEEAKQVVLDNAAEILKAMLMIRAHSGRKILPRKYARDIVPDTIGKAEPTRIITSPSKSYFTPHGKQNFEIKKNKLIPSVQKEKTMESIMEGFTRLKGSSKTSYQTLESVRLVIQHKIPVNEEVRGSRSRNIRAIFVECHGERFRFPVNDLRGARSMARHINEGGKIDDTVGNYIVEAVQKTRKLREFVRYAKTNKLINEGTQDIVEIVKENILTLSKDLHKLTGARTYESIKARIEESTEEVLAEENLDELRDKFTVKRFDEKFLEILPTVNTMMNEKQSFLRKLEESSEVAIMLDADKFINDTIIEHTTTEGKLSHQLYMISESIMENDDLANFVSSIASKLNEATELTAFESTILGNVLKNATVNEGYKILPPMDTERYTDMSGEGLEGPFRLKSGMVVYYDPQAGKYYDRDTDMYLSDEDYFAHSEGSVHSMHGADVDEDFAGMAAGAKEKYNKYKVNKKVSKNNSKKVRQATVNEAKPQTNSFTGDDINRIATMPLDAAKAAAIDIINNSTTTNPRAETLRRNVGKTRDSGKVAYLLYNMLLAGEGLSTIGSRYQSHFESKEEKMFESALLKHDPKNIF